MCMHSHSEGPVSSRKHWHWPFASGVEEIAYLSGSLAVCIRLYCMCVCVCLSLFDEHRWALLATQTQPKKDSFLFQSLTLSQQTTKTEECTLFEVLLRCTDLDKKESIAYTQVLYYLYFKEDNIRLERAIYVFFFFIIFHDKHQILRWFTCQ